MFLFEGNFGKILHTGDCRLTHDCLQKLPDKYLAKKGKEHQGCLDYVFLDCTFSRDLMKIPSKHMAIQQVKDGLMLHSIHFLYYLVIFIEHALHKYCLWLNTIQYTSCRNYSLHE